MHPILSSSVGDADRFVSFDALVEGLAALPPAPTDLGRVRLIVRRGADGLRETPQTGRLSAAGGLEGDAWGRRPERDPQVQITVMEHEVNVLLANGQPLTLAGDNLLVDLNLSALSLPPGSRLRIGAALVEVTPEPHNGCSKFRARFGGDALRLVAQKERRHLNLRGVHVRVVEDGEVAVGDEIVVVSRPA
jgi:MOSC domain-containing protein YiiM